MKSHIQNSTNHFFSGIMWQHDLI